MTGIQQLIRQYPTVYMLVSFYYIKAAVKLPDCHHGGIMLGVILQIDWHPPILKEITCQKLDWAIDILIILWHIVRHCKDWLVKGICISERTRATHRIDVVLPFVISNFMAIWRVLIEWMASALNNVDLNLFFEIRLFCHCCFDRKHSFLDFSRFCMWPRENCVGKHHYWTDELIEWSIEVHWENVDNEMSSS